MVPVPGSNGDCSLCHSVICSMGCLAGPVCWVKKFMSLNMLHPFAFFFHLFTEVHAEASKSIYFQLSVLKVHLQCASAVLNKLLYFITTCFSIDKLHLRSKEQGRLLFSNSSGLLRHLLS